MDTSYLYKAFGEQTILSGSNPNRFRCFGSLLPKPGRARIGPWGDTMSRWHNLYLDGHAHLVTATVRNWHPVLEGQAVDVLYQEWSAARARLPQLTLEDRGMPSPCDEWGAVRA